MFPTLALIGAALLLVTWVLYPLVIGLLSRIARSRGVRYAELTDAELPTVTVVIATIDAAPLVEARVLDILASAYPLEKLDVVVAVDARAADITPESLQHLSARVRTVCGDEPGGKCPTLNAGVRAAAGDVVCFTDTHQRFDATAIRHMVTSLKMRGYGATSGRIVLPRDGASSLVRRYTQYEVALREGEAELHSAVGVSGAVYVMWRSLWKPLPAGLILDDLFTPMRLVLAGHRIGFEREAIAHEQRRVVPSQEYRRKVRTLTGNFQLCAWLPAVLVPVRNPIWFQFVCHKLLRLVTPYGVLLLAIGVTGEIVLRLGERLPAALAAAAVAGIWIGFGRDAVATRLRSIAIQFVSLQAAVVMATMNAVRGRWDVWQR